MKESLFELVENLSFLESQKHITLNKNTFIRELNNIFSLNCNTSLDKNHIIVTLIESFNDPVFLLNITNFCLLNGYLIEYVKFFNLEHIHGRNVKYEIFKDYFFTSKQFENFTSLELKIIANI